MKRDPTTLDRFDARLPVVDDNEDNRYTLLQRLLREGYHNILQAADGVEAMALLNEAEVDLVLLDVLMPEMDGYQVLEQIRRDPGLRNIPVIVISAIDEIETVVRCIESGAEDYLQKPFNTVLLRARIQASLNKDYDSRVLISGDSVDLLSGKYPLEPMGGVSIRGKSAPVEIYRLVGTD